MGTATKIFFLTFLIYRSAIAQIYDYDPIRHNNFEINPAYLANGKTVFSSNFVHQGASFSKYKFYYDACRFSFYNRNYFTGLGVSINNTHVNDSASYRYIGIGGAYRAIMFNKMYAKIGLMYKVMSYRSAQGYYGYYSFSPISDARVKQRVNDNANISLALSSVQDRFYVSAGILNYQPWRSADTNFSFPQYYFLNVGDFGKIFKLRNWEITYNAFTKKYNGKNTLPVSHYITALYSGYHLSRSGSMRYGSRLGWAEESYVQANPSIAYFQKLDRRNKYILFQLMFDLGYDPLKNKMLFKQGPQFNLTYQF